jgi:processive 1,2-diacylglycerol beta-glucosyltransferase
MIYKHRYNKSMNRVTSLALHRLFYSQTKAIIRQLRPDIIVCTHPFPSVIVSRLKRAGLMTPLFTIITDYDAHGTWIDPKVDKYLVSTENVQSKLLEHGVPPSSIEVTGIPVHPSFRVEYSKEQIRSEFGLKEMPTVMIMGGGWGVFNKEEKNMLLDYVASWRESIQLILCFGTNDKARQLLLEEDIYQHPNIHVMGYTTEINKLMDVSDLLITKPGGMTCTEGLAKGIPMLFYSAIPGQEEENCQYFEQMGYGQQITSPELIDHWFRLILDHYPALEQRRARVRNQFKIQAQGCSQSIMKVLQLDEDDQRRTTTFMESPMQQPIAYW